MARALADYIALALVGDLKVERDIFDDGPFDFTGDRTQLKERVEIICGFSVSENMLSKVIRTLADCGLVRVTDDTFSGEFVKIRATRLKNFFGSAREEINQAKEDDKEVGILTRPSDYPNAFALAKHEVFDDYNELGSAWLVRAIDGIRQRVSEAGSLEALENSGFVESFNAPASDRVVTFSDNQINDFEAQATEVIDAVSAQNQIVGEPGLRELLIGQLKAGRELIRAGSFRLYFLEITLIQTLQFLAKRYEKEAIGALAAALMTALLKQLGIGA